MKKRNIKFQRKDIIEPRPHAEFLEKYSNFTIAQREQKREEKRENFLQVERHAEKTIVVQQEKEPQKPKSPKIEPRNSQFKDDFDSIDFFPKKKQMLKAERKWDPKLMKIQMPESLKKINYMDRIRNRLTSLLEREQPLIDIKTLNENENIQRILANQKRKSIDKNTYPYVQRLRKEADSFRKINKRYNKQERISKKSVIPSNIFEKFDEKPHAEMFIQPPSPFFDNIVSSDNSERFDNSGSFFDNSRGPIDNSTSNFFSNQSEFQPHFFEPNHFRENLAEPRIVIPPLRSQYVRKERSPQNSMQKSSNFYQPLQIVEEESSNFWTPLPNQPKKNKKEYMNSFEIQF